MAGLPEQKNSINPDVFSERQPTPEEISAAKKLLERAGESEGVSVIPERNIAQAKPREIVESNTQYPVIAPGIGSSSEVFNQSQQSDTLPSNKVFDRILKLLNKQETVDLKKLQVENKIVDVKNLQEFANNASDHQE